MPASGFPFLLAPLPLRNTLWCRRLRRILLRLWRHAQETRHNLPVPLRQVGRWAALLFHIGNLAKLVERWK